MRGTPEAGQAAHALRRCRGGDGPHEQGQAATFKDTVRTCQRGRRLMGQKINFPLEDIIVDRNALSTATVFPERNAYGKRDPGRRSERRGRGQQRTGPKQ